MKTFHIGFLDALRSIRRDIHAHPEFGFEETRTSRQVASLLQACGMAVTTGVGKTGVVGTLRRGTATKSIILRADMDALRIAEAPGEDRPHASTRSGYMHACGHDGHTAMLLGAAQILAQEGGFDGAIHFVFQPAEEWGQGMLAMLEDGLLERFPAAEAYALHNAPGLPIGRFETCSGAFKSAEDNFEIRISGKGVHSARPHQGRDALVAAAATVTALQTVVSRVIPPSEMAVVSCTSIHSSGTRNVSSGEVVIDGDCRSFSPAVSQLIEEELTRVARGVADAHGCTAEVKYTRVFVPTVNDAALTQNVKRLMERSFGPGCIEADAPANTGSEDFGQLLRRVPGCYANLGNGDSASLHNAAYDFCDDALPYGVGFFVAVARDRLPAP
ncbi:MULTISPECIES: amidohydrolase [unclassified Variovorax]|uniref:amidohydrolase n=1 Tax=unclassified Variovorax TaxID=663243 RepID=UPI0025753772|nr:MULTISPECIES: amidohydrolase [unclassified Variovorax]MDM0088314.1 amidohydrolase [Variovorax sp. J22G40]MDM0146387.1 amidohydrolase [Variovorax sp. J2P1-31]